MYDCQKYMEAAATDVRGFVGEDGICIGGETYRNVYVTEFENRLWLVSRKAILTINITAHCNAQCDFCYNGISFMPSDLHTNDAFKFGVQHAIDFACAANVRNVSISGGEPTLFPDRVLTSLQYALGKFRGFMRLHTNGTHLDGGVTFKGTVSPLWQHLIRLGITNISISLASFDRDANARVMGLKAGSAPNDEQLRRWVRKMPGRLRLSCFLHSSGVWKSEDAIAYYNQGSALGVTDYVFRLPGGETPREHLLASKYLAASSKHSSTEALVSAFETQGFVVTYRRRDVDYDLWILRKGTDRVSIDRASDVPDPDRKIRRLIVMANGVCYTSWLNPASHLFPDDGPKIVRGAIGAGAKSARAPAFDARNSLFSSPEDIDVDLHVHSTLSDGRLRPSQVIEMARASGLKELCFTEHHGVHSRFHDLQRYGEKCGIRLAFPGTEVTALHETPGLTLRVHILVFGYALLSSAWADLFAEANTDRNKDISEAYNDLIAAGMDLAPLDQIMFVKEEEDAISSRMVASSMTALLGAVTDRKHRRSAHLSRTLLERNAAVRRIRRALPLSRYLELAQRTKCVTILAHPGWVRDERGSSMDAFDRVLDCVVHMRRQGLDGIEVFHSRNARERQTLLLSLARSLDLIVTGGSDFHGRDNDRLGVVGTSRNQFSRILDRLHLAR